MDFATKFFLKNLYDDLRYTNTGISTRMSPKIRKAVYTNKGMNEICSNMRFSIASAATVIYDSLTKYAEFKNIDTDKTSLSDIYGMFKDDVKTMYEDAGETFDYNEYTILDRIVINIKEFIRTCDNIINFTQYTYRVEAQTNDKFEKLSLKDMLDTYNLSTYSGENIFADNRDKDSYIDESTTSPEFGKTVCKRLRSMKADILSATNKYFGKNSKLVSFNIMNIVV